MWHKIRSFLFLSILFISIFLYTYCFSPLLGDEIWNYGFSYNVVTGLIPYLDFNMIVTPLFSFIGAIFISIFGHHLWAIHLLNAILIEVIILIVYKKVGKKIILFVPVLLLYCDPGYNLFCLFLVLILMEICDQKFHHYDVVMGVLCGLIFLTKQTVGITLLIPLLYYSKKKIKTIISYLFPILLLLLYLIYYDAVYQFVDYCFLGMFDFSGDNKCYLFLPFELIVCFILIKILIQSKFENKRIFYLLMYQIMTIPIVDGKHFFTGFVPVLAYLLEVVQIKKYQFKYFCIMAIFMILFYSYTIHSFENYDICRDQSSYLFGRNIVRGLDENIINIRDYINRVEGDYDHIYFLTWHSYIIKLYNQWPIHKYDLINNGNMGYHGSERYLKELKNNCSNAKCLFVLIEDELDDNSQTSVEILEYVIGKYPKIEEVDYFDIYSN